MTRFQFRMSKLQRFQKQKQRLAEIETLRAKAEFDKTLGRLKQLTLRFDQVASSCNENLADNVQLTHARRDMIEYLRQEIEKALEMVKETELAWKRSAEQGTAEKIKSESYELLHDSEQANHAAAIEKSEISELSDIVMRQWSDAAGETSDG